MITPVLLELRARAKSSVHGSIDMCGVPLEAIGAVATLLAAKGMARKLTGESLEIELTSLGSFVVERCGR